LQPSGHCHSRKKFLEMKAPTLNMRKSLKYSLQKRKLVYNENMIGGQADVSSNYGEEL
jgi:hypothetical protein